jgi:hypothetical protein
MTETGASEDASASPSRGVSLSAWAVVAAFGTYFCMYAFRKPFTASTYADITLWGMGFKSVLVLAQVLGYALSKFLGIKVVSEVTPGRRVLLLLALIGIAEGALLLFAITPAPFNVFWLFCNGVPLGMVFGLVLGFLEGRQHTEALAAGLCLSFILADGITRSVGGYLLLWGVSDAWMPFFAGLVFVPPLLLFAWMLNRVPPPSPQDVAARSERTPMNGRERWDFFRRYAAGLTLLVLVFLLITVLRNIRGDFMREIWGGLQAEFSPDLFGWTEAVVAAGVLVLNGSVVFIVDNRRAFFAGLILSVAGVLLIGGSLLALHAGALSPFVFQVLLGLGLYLPYIAVHITLFERLIALTRDRGNIGYLMYLADAAGYFGYVVALLVLGVLGKPANFLTFFVPLSWFVAIVCLLLLIPCWRAFALHPATQSSLEPLGPVRPEPAAAGRSL